MQLLQKLDVADVVSGIDVKTVVAEAARAVPPLWPLESAIAVNPLAGFEDRPFAAAVEEAASLFGANATMPHAQWQALLSRGDITEQGLRSAAIEWLGGLDASFAMIGVDVSRLDLLMARLRDQPAEEPEPDLLAAFDPALSRQTRSAAWEPLSPTERTGVAMLGYARAFVAKWCGAFFDRSIACAGMPHREEGFYRAVLKLAAYDPDFWRFGGDDSAAIVASAEQDPHKAIAQSLVALGLEGDNQIKLLRQLVARLPGWAGHIRWRSEHGDMAICAARPADMADYLALWLLVERACALKDWPQEASCIGAHPATHAAARMAARVGLTEAMIRDLPPHGFAALHEIAAMNDGALGLVWMRAAELSYRDPLMARIETAAVGLAAAPEQRPAAQLVMCIDIRSEPFRRAIEACGDYETFGYAGFFGLPIATVGPCGERDKRLPVLLDPVYDVQLQAALPRDRDALAKRRGARAGAELIQGLKAGAATTFAAAEALGPFGALISAARTCAPKIVRRLTKGEPKLQPALDSHGCLDGLPLPARIAAAKGLFAFTGMSRRTARLVVLAGHGGEAVNNPYASALDCGACGGHAGGINARTLAVALNDPSIRAALAEAGDAIPTDTVFLAAEHNTTTDEVTVFGADCVPATHATELHCLMADLAAAGRVCRERRAQQLGGGRHDAFAAASHWGEVRPEWGLARNAAFIVGPRALTRDIDLEGRAFLHSYDWRTDPDNSALTLILTAPMVVAQWINCQYLFSTLDNDRYGAGDKTTHNVMGGIGVVQGNGGDLRVGLPRQSLFHDDGSPCHVPQRLLAVVHAPLDKVEQVIDANEILQRLFGLGWVQLIVVDPVTNSAKRWRTDAELKITPEVAH